MKSSWFSVVVALFLIFCIVFSPRQSLHELKELCEEDNDTRASHTLPVKPENLTVNAFFESMNPGGLFADADCNFCIKSSARTLNWIPGSDPIFDNGIINYNSFAKAKTACLQGFTFRERLLTDIHYNYLFLLNPF